MTREEAIYRLKNTAWLGTDKDREETVQAVDMAIKALRELPKRRKEVKRWKTKALKAEPVCEHFYKGYCGRFEDGCFRQCQAEPKHEKWIPVSERLPKDNGWVIITILDEYGDTPYRYTAFGWYLEVANCWIVDAEQRIDVTAWMPLPEPYKGGDLE